jgi:hypothetical protein
MERLHVTNSLFTADDAARLSELIGLELDNVPFNAETWAEYNELLNRENEAHRLAHSPE